MVIDERINQLLSVYADTKEAAKPGLLQAVTIAAGESWFSSYPPRYAHFVQSGMISRRISLEDGSTVSVNTSPVGGLVELREIMAPHDHLCKMVAVLPARAVRVPFESVCRAFIEDAEFALSLGRAVAQQCSQAEQISACRAFHSVEARAANYLCGISAVWGEPLPLREEILAEEIGALPATIALIVCNFQEAGLLESGSEGIHILDRSGLAKLACNCDSGTQGRFSAHLPFPLVPYDDF